MPVELHATSPDHGGVPLESVPDFRWAAATFRTGRRRYSVEKGSFATLIGHWRTGHRIASRCGEPGALPLFTFIGQSRFD
jgi:hypothetical protein